MNKSRSRGFTIVELAVTIVVMSILIGIVGLSLNNHQVNGRNEERKADITSIATYLDNAYSNGYSRMPTLKGGYPSVYDMNSDTKLDTIFYDLDRENLRAPGSETYSLKVATSATENLSILSPKPTPDTYVYQPIMTGNNLCSNATDNCRRFNLYYMLENDDTIHKVSSRNQ